jgi:hypothetical protein
MLQQQWWEEREGWVHSHLDHHRSIHATQVNSCHTGQFMSHRSLVTCHICSLSPLLPLHTCWSSLSTLQLLSQWVCFRKLGNLLSPACPPFVNRQSNATAFLYSSTAEIWCCANGHKQHALVHHGTSSTSPQMYVVVLFCPSSLLFLLSPLCFYIYLISLLLRMEEAGVSHVPLTSQCILTYLLFLPCWHLLVSCSCPPCLETQLTVWPCCVIAQQQSCRT